MSDEPESARQEQESLPGPPPCGRLYGRRLLCICMPGRRAVSAAADSVPRYAGQLRVDLRPVEEGARLAMPDAKGLGYPRRMPGVHVARQRVLGEPTDLQHFVRV